jgi:hypothetical protein
LGKRCSDHDCPYLAADGTCLLSEDELRENCPAREKFGHEDKDEWIDEDYIKERVKSKTTP